MQKLKALQAAVEASPDKQVSLTDRDTRLMVIGDRLTGVVGYNVQTAVETEHHLIIAHEVTNQGDRGQLPKMAAKAEEAIGFDEIEVIADAGYYRGPDLLTCRDIGLTALTPRTNTSNAKAEGGFGKEAFVYLPERTPIAVRPANPHAPLRQHGRRSHHVHLLVHGLRDLSDEKSVYDGKAAPRQTLGA